jgi:cell division septation protein DedD
MTYDFSFDGKSLWGLLAGAFVLCALIFFTGLLVGVGWSEKPRANAQGAAQASQPAAQTAAQPVSQPAVQPVPAQPAAITPATEAQASAFYDDPARQEYAASGYGATAYGPRDYAPQGGGQYGPPGYYGPPRYYPQGATNASGAAASAATAQSSAAPGPYAGGRREAARLSARGADAEPRLVSEADDAAQYSTGAARPPAYSVQVGAYLEEKEARSLAEQLENKGYTPTVFSGLDAEARTWYAVRIGSYSNPKDAGQAAANFERQEKMKTVVRPADSL